MSRKRRYFGCLGMLTAVAAIAVIANAILSWHYRRAGDAVAPAGYPNSFDELVRRQNTDDGRPNGAADLLAAFEAFTDDGVDYDLLPVMGTPDAWPEPGEPVRPEVLAEMRKIVSLNRECLALLRSGVRAETVRFQMPAGENMPFAIDQFGGEFRNAARLLEVQALHAGEVGDIDASIDSLNTMLLLGDRYARQPSLLTYHVGGAVIGLGLGGGETLITRERLNEEGQFERLSELFDGATTGDIAYAMWTDGLWAQRYGNRRDAVRERLKDVLVQKSSGGALLRIVEQNLYLYSFVTDIDVLEMRRRLRLAVDHTREPLLDGLRKLGEMSIPEGPVAKQYVLTDERLPGQLSKYISIEGRYRAQVRSMATAVRVAQFRHKNNRLPDATEFTNVVKPSRDPMEGGALRYRATDDGFVVYSVGPNGRDDGGATREDDADDFVVEIHFAPQPTEETASSPAN